MKILTPEFRQVKQSDIDASKIIGYWVAARKKLLTAKFSTKNEPIMAKSFFVI